MCRVRAQRSGSFPSVAMTGFHVHLVFMPRQAIMRGEAFVGYGPIGVAKFLARSDVSILWFTSGCYLVMSNSKQHWPTSEIYESNQPFSTVGFSHQGWRKLGQVYQQPYFDSLNMQFNGVSISGLPVPDLNPIWFVDRFVAAVSSGIYREAFVFCGHHGGIDIYSRFSFDQPIDCFEALRSNVTDPALWWTGSTEPIPTGRSEVHVRGQWHYVPMQIRAATSMI